MRVSVIFLLMVAALCTVEGKGGLQIGVKKRPETCDMRTKKGDRLSMHYTVRQINIQCAWLHNILDINTLPVSREH